METDTSHLLLLRSEDHHLSHCVRCCLEDYFQQIDGHESSNLFDLVISAIEKPLLETTLKHTDYNQTKAAKILGLSRSTLRKKLEQHAIG